MLDAFASGFLVFAFTATALFQLALVLGAPMGEYAYLTLYLWFATLERS